MTVAKTTEFDMLPDAMKIYLLEQVFHDLSKMKGFIKARQEDPRHPTDAEIKQKILKSIEKTFNALSDANTPTPAITPPPKKEEKDNTMPSQAEREREHQQEEIIKKLSIAREGTKLIVPEGVEFATAIRAIKLKMEEEEQDVAINHMLPFPVSEGMVAFLRVLQREYGFVSNTGSFHPFWGKEPPQYLGIEISPGVRESIPVGELRIPGISGYLTPTFGVRQGHAVFKITGECKGKDRHQVDKIVKMVEEECRRFSIYRGHTITTSFPVVEECSGLEDTFPQFAQLGEVLTEQVIFSRDVEEQIDVSLFVPIKQTENCRLHKIPLKRGVLLEGPYGTGKTLTAAATATLCRKHGWTFIYLKNVMRLAEAYHFAANYQPAVIFAEDIDQILLGNSDEKIEKNLKQLQNAMDGIDTKGIEVITVLTTNHLEKMALAMLRPGRLDTVVSVRPPDDEASLRLVRMYAGALLDENADLEHSNVGTLLSGEIPAIIREVVERSKLAALRRGGDCLKLTANDIEVTARSMKNHMQLLKNPEPDERSNEELAAAKIADGLVEAAKIRSRAPSDHSFVSSGDNHKSVAATG